MEISLHGKVALITGASRGIGKAIANSYVQAGAKVMLSSRKEEALRATAKEIGGDTEIFAANGGDLEAGQACVMATIERFGGIDILVNNAGVGIMRKTVEEITPGEFRQTIETNLFGTYYACHYAIPMLKRRGGGYIINISSLAGQNPNPGMAAYNASKFGLNGFTEAMMQEVRHDNIKVSYICPGSVNTEFGGDSVSDEKAWQIQPDDIAQIVIDLLSMESRTLPSKVEVRPSRPPVKQ